MNFKRFETQVPSEYQELTFIANSGTQYIDTGLKGSDLADCELEIVMRNDTTTLTSYNFNGTYLSGSTAQFGLVATSSSECRSSINFGFADVISTTGLNASEFHTIYATNGLQKVDNTVVGTFNFGTMNDGNFLLFARTDPSQTSGINICKGMSLKSFTVKRNNQYIRNMIPAKRKSDNTFGLYDTANDVFYTNQGTYYFTGGTVVEPTWHSIPHYIHNTSTDTITTLPADIYANDTTATVGLKGDMSQTGTPTPTTPIQPSECGERTKNLAPPNWAEDFVQRINNSAKAYISNNILYIFASAGYGEYDTKYVFKADWKENTQYTFNLIYRRDSAYSDAAMLQITYTDGTTTAFPKTINDGEWHTIYITSEVGKTIKYLNVWYSSNWLEIKIDNFFVYEGTVEKPFEPYGYKIPILNNSQTTNVYLGEVESIRRVKKLVLTGEENFVNQTVSGIILVSLTRPVDMPQYTSGIISSHFVKSSPASNVGEFYVGGSYINFNYDGINDVTTFKTYLQQQYAAGTPVCVWYVLATPQTAVVNEPIRKIGDYADTVSGITIPTIAGANTISVGTTLQPSEVTVNYKGWHPVTDVHERESGAWD